jgi:hypothetical protein
MKNEAGTTAPGDWKVGRRLHPLPIPPHDQIQLGSIRQSTERTTELLVPHVKHGDAQWQKEKRQA